MYRSELQPPPADLKRPAEGVLVYTLATPSHDTSTLDFSARPSMNISTDEVTLSVGPEPRLS
jgi:hypothetical protein